MSDGVAIIGKRFLRQVATLVGGAALAQLIPLLAAPVLTRLYTPEGFGVLVAFVAWLSNLSVVVTGRYELAIILPKEDSKAANLVVLALGCVLGLGLLSTVLGLVLAPYAAQWPATRDVAPWFPTLASAASLVGVVQVWTNWNNRFQRYHVTALARIVQSVCVVLVQLVLGFMGVGSAGLIWGQIVGQLSALLVLIKHDIGVRFRWLAQVNWSDVLGVARAHIVFPSVNAPAAFINALQETLAAILLIALSGSMTLGFYGLVMRILKLPAGLIGQAVAQVFYRDLAAARHAGVSLKPLVKKMIFSLFLLALPGFFLVAFLGAPLFSWIFGETWRKAGYLAQAAAPYILFHFIASPLAMVPLVIGYQRAALGFTLLGNSLYLGSLALGLLIWQDVVNAFWLTSLIMIIYFTIYMRWLYCMCKVT